MSPANNPVGTGAGAASRAAIPRRSPLSKHGLDLWNELSPALGVDVGFRRTGVLFVTQDPAELATWESWTARAREHQVHSRMLSAAEAQALAPGCSIDWRGGLHTPSDGRAEPARAAPAIADAARRHGATIHQDCAARGLELQAGAVAAVVTERGTIRTQAVLCAGGAWASLFCRRHGIDLPQANVIGSALYTAPAPALTEGAIGTPRLGLRRRLDGGYTIAMRGRGTVDLTPQALRYARPFWPTFVQRRRNLKFRIGRAFLRELIGGAGWPLDAPSPFESVRVLDPSPDRSLLAQALAETRTAFPALRDIDIAESWGGVIRFDARRAPRHLSGRGVARLPSGDRFQRPWLRRRSGGRSSRRRADHRAPHRRRPDPVPL